MVSVGLKMTLKYHEVLAYLKEETSLSVALEAYVAAEEGKYLAMETLGNLAYSKVENIEAEEMEEMDAVEDKHFLELDG